MNEHFFEDPNKRGNYNGGAQRTFYNHDYAKRALNFNVS